MECCIIGGAKFNSQIPNNIFTIGTNLHYLQANIIVSIDDNILKQIFTDDLFSGFVVTSYKQYDSYRDKNNCIELNYKTWYNVNSLSSGLLAIVLANKLNFNTVNLFGFSNLLNQEHHHYKIYNTIKEKRNYIIWQ